MSVFIRILLGLLISFVGTVRIAWGNENANKPIFWIITPLALFVFLVIVYFISSMFL